MTSVRRFIQYYNLVIEHGGLPDYHRAVRQLVEMLVVFILRGIGPGYYLMAEMNKKEYGWKYKLGFYNGKKYVRRVNHLNDTKYYPITFNKLIEKSILNQYALSTPQFYAHLDVLGGKDYIGQSIDSALDFHALLDKCGADRICFKLTGGFGGKGFRAVDVVRKEGGIYLRDLADNKPYQIQDFIDSLNIQNNGTYLVEEYFRQHDRVAQLNPSSVNTLRIMVYQKTGEKPECFGAFFKMGREGKLVDNGMAGGILAKVDLDSARLGAGFYSGHRRQVFIDHPDSLLSIKGFEVPFFRESIILACNAVSVFPGINYAGVDIAIGNNGPTVIELNARADYVDFAIINMPSKIVLG